MRESNRNKLEKGVAILHRLHIKSEDIMLTGSVALDLVGVLPESRESGDVDFIIKVDEQDWRCMKLLEAIVNDGKENLYPGGNRCLIFKFDDLTLNVWKKTPEFDWSDIKDNVTGVYVSKVDNILKVKKSYGRPKDFKDINDICKNILA